MQEKPVSTDLFGNTIDHEVGYARGKILKDSIAEREKLNHAVRKIRERLHCHGADDIYVFTGNYRWNSLLETDLGIRSEEWVGPSIFYPALKELTLKHLGAGSGEGVDVGFFNRTTAGIISTVVALLKPGQAVISIAPHNKPHPSVVRAARLAGARYVGVSAVDEINTGSKLEGVCIITPVTSELHLSDLRDTVRAIKYGNKTGLTTLVDDAYGARIRPVLLNQPHALHMGADLVITNNDKAGLRGPRAGIMAGKTDLVNIVTAKALEFGMEARAPLSLGVLRSLEKYSPDHLLDNVRVGKGLFNELVKGFGVDNVRETLLGPEISADHLLRYILGVKKIEPDECSIVPAEAAAAVAFILLEKHGILLVNAGGAPGSRVSFRIKAEKETVQKFGGTHKVAGAIMDAVIFVADRIGSPNKIQEIILGN